MRRRLLGGATGQIVGIVVISLIAAHGLSAAAWLLFDMRPGPPPEFVRPTSEMTLVLRLLKVLPAEDHATILTAATQSGLRSAEGTGTPPPVVADVGPAGRGLRHAITQEPELADETATVGHRSSPDGPVDGVAVLFQHQGRWILFDLPPLHHRHAFPPHWISPSGAAWLMAIPLLIGFVAFWAARRVASPLVRLAGATEGVSILQDPTPVAEEGTREVRQVAHAFNSVIHRLRSFVTDRTRMLASISHDLRTPLTRLRLRAETLDDPEVAKRMLRDIRTMESMITATLAFIREEAAQEPVERIDIAVLLQTICDEFSDSGTDVHYEGPLHCAASCRLQALQRALVNLIDNAAKFDARITARLRVAADRFTIEIEDDGPGIPDAQKEEVFKPFVRGDLSRSQPGESTGLGLSIVKAIVQSHHGQIELKDRPPHGLCVRVTIPFEAAPLAVA